MYVVMHCGGIPFNGDTIKTKSLGGSESAAYYVARELVKQGHHVTIFTNTDELGMFDGVKYENAGVISDDAPLGDRFTYYAENTPHDVCIIQRHPRAFERKLASKVNMWWLHDLALYRNRDQVLGQMWNVDRVLCVSEYHKAQVSKVWGIEAAIIDVVKNGVDVSQFAVAPMLLPKAKHIFYSSRPERGLINLVGVGGIMERLKDENIHLHVCGYENTTPQMAEMYSALWARCEQLPNVTNHGALTKAELASLMSACDAWVYPTEFEEVSCITAMEAMAAGCEIIASDFGALPETCATAIATLIPVKNGRADVEAFTSLLTTDRQWTNEMRVAQLATAYTFSWGSVADRIMASAEQLMSESSPLSLSRHFLRHSDIPAFEMAQSKVDYNSMTVEAASALTTEYTLGYKFYRENTYAEHYKAFYEYEAARGIEYGPEDVTRTTRYMAVAGQVSLLPAGSRVLDYGCAHGHYTVALAKSFPHLNFVGADLAQSNVDKAVAWAKAEGLTNVNFVKVDGVDSLTDAAFVAQYPLGFGLIIAAEVIEHVGNPQEYVDSLSSNLTENGHMVITVPYGPWEAQGYRQHGYWRAHLHHFEREDLHEMLGHHPEYKIIAAPSGLSQFHTPLGSYIVTFAKPTEASRSINYVRKINHTMPDQTVTCCMIVKDAEADIMRCIGSVLPHVQEFIIGVDETTTDKTSEMLHALALDNPLVSFSIRKIKSPRETGFDAARNSTLEQASGDWILWIDSDEVLVNGSMLARHTRNSMFNGFAIRQHHLSQDPVAVIKVDLPCRLFRNHKGIKFFGRVHEHPEMELNEGLGPVSVMPSVSIIHYGYTDERVRRGRFDRNLPLLKRDRKEQPDRILGKFLWLRDLAQSCQYDMEDGRPDPAEFDKRIHDGMKMWKELVESKNYRIVVDALPYYSTLMQLRGDGLDFSFAVDSSYVHGADASKTAQVSGHFADETDALNLMVCLAKDRIGEQDRRYL